MGVGLSPVSALSVGLSVYLPVCDLSRRLTVGPKSQGSDLVQRILVANRSLTIKPIFLVIFSLSLTIALWVGFESDSTHHFPFFFYPQKTSKHMLMSDVALFAQLNGVSVAIFTWPWSPLYVIGLKCATECWKAPLSCVFHYHFALMLIAERVERATGWYHHYRHHLHKLQANFRLIQSNKTFASHLPRGIPNFLYSLPRPLQLELQQKGRKEPQSMQWIKRNAWQPWLRAVDNPEKLWPRVKEPPWPEQEVDISQAGFGFGLGLGLVLAFLGLATKTCSIHSGVPQRKNINKSIEENYRRKSKKKIENKTTVAFI